MALGKRRRERQLEAFVAASDLPRSPGHPFYTALNRLLAANGFGQPVEFHARKIPRRCSRSLNTIANFLPNAVHQRLAAVALHSAELPGGR